MIGSVQIFLKKEQLNSVVNLLTDKLDLFLDIEANKIKEESFKNSLINSSQKYNYVILQNLCVHKFFPVLLQKHKLLDFLYFSTN
jgi:hypothetical protein